jgi:hypothetical protein
MMLRADQIELAVLNLLVDWEDSLGRWFDLSNFISTLKVTLGAVSDRESIDALTFLWESQMIALVDEKYAPYEPAQGSEFFYRGRQFRCTARPRARRRQQELNRDTRQGIFISHIGEETLAAKRLQRTIEEALSPKVNVFVSSDYKSIASGQSWYDSILAGIRKSKVIILLLSPASIERRWINFEAGIGIGDDSVVIPVVWRGLSKGGIEMPLGRLQARELHAGEEMAALISDLGAICSVAVNQTPVEAFLADLPSIEAQTPISGLEVTPLRDGRAICLSVRNTGNRPLEMIDAELLVPSQLGPTLYDSSPVRELAKGSDNGILLRGYRLTTIPSPVPNLGIDPLRPTLVPAMGEVVLAGMNIVLPKTLSSEEEQLPIRYRVSAQQVTYGPKMLLISEIPTRKPN